MGSSQLSLLNKISLEHGGRLSRGRRKGARPLATKRAMHVVFRSRYSLMHLKRAEILALKEKLAKRNDITVYKFSNNDNHLHLVIRGKYRRGIQSFLRVFAGQVAQLMTGAKKGKRGDTFWEVPVWTRIVEWVKAFRAALAYVVQNQREAAGEAPYTPRKPRALNRARPGPASGPGHASPALSSALVAERSDPRT